MLTRPGVAILPQKLTGACDMISLLLYCALGAALAASGVSLIDKPWQFLVIMAIVVGIDHTR